MHRIYISLLLVVAVIACNTEENTHQHKKIQMSVMVKTTKSWDGSTLPHYAQGQPEVTILKVIIPPKTTLKWHKHPYINAAVMLEGELNVFSKDGDSLKIGKGQSFVELVEKYHYGRNEGSTNAELIVFYAGIEGQPITLEEK